MSETQAIKPVPFINSSALKNSRFSNTGRLDKIFGHTGDFQKMNVQKEIFPEEDLKFEYAAISIS